MSFAEIGLATDHQIMNLILAQLEEKKEGVTDARDFVISKMIAKGMTYEQAVAKYEQESRHGRQLKRTGAKSVQRP